MIKIAFAPLLLASTIVAGASHAQSTSKIVGLAPQPEPYATKSVVNHPRTIGWPEGRKPVAPRGYEVVKFAGGLDYPRQALLLPNGDVLVAEARTKRDPAQFFDMAVRRPPRHAGVERGGCVAFRECATRRKTCLPIRGVRSGARARRTRCAPPPASSPRRT